MLDSDLVDQYIRHASKIMNDFWSVTIMVQSDPLNLPHDTKTHCIGFSLGSHACGIIGKNMKVHRITGGMHSL